MENCCVCFNTDANLMKIKETGLKNDIPIKSQLENIVPEVTWLEHYGICCKCQDNLHLIQEFRQQCIQSQKLREMEIKVEEPEIEDHITDVPSLIDPLSTDKLVSGDPATSKNPLSDRQKVCSYCGKTFKKQSDLLTHEKTHLNLREYECKLCHKKFNTHKNLHTHKLIKHSDPEKWRFQCSFCNKRFPIKSNYEFHVKRHNNIREFKCNLCGKEFRDKYIIKKHLLVHSGFRQFKCDLCGISYRQKFSLELHRFKVHQIGNVKVPEVIKKHKCELCDRAFDRIGTLNKHLLAHKRDKPFKCDLCEKWFSVERNVRRHKKRMHNVMMNVTVKEEEK